MSEQITIKTAEDLLGALRNDNLSVCAATIKAIVGQPDKAVSVCSKSGLDLFDELLHLCDRGQDQTLRSGYIFALLNLGDPRSMAFAKREFQETDDSRTILLTAKEIAKLSQQERINFLAPILLAGDRPTKTRAAANLLVDCHNLSPDLSMRIAVISDHEMPIPPVDSKTLDTWLVELQGPYPLAALKLLKKIHIKGISVLMPFWKRLPKPILIQVLHELSKMPCKQEGERVRDIVRASAGEVLLWALKCLQRLPGRDADEEILEPLHQHENPAIRAVAIGSGTTRLNWATVLATEPSEEVRLAIISRIQFCQDAAAINLLTPLVQDQSWRIRARTTTALVALAPESLDLLRGMLSHPDDHVRASACQALNALGQEELIKDAFEV